MRCTLLLLLFFVQACGAQEPDRPARPPQGGPVGGGCDGCQYMWAGLPAQINSTDTSAGWKEGGTRMLLQGRVFQRDGQTPATGVLIYYWQTDPRGRYDPRGDTSRGARAHGRIRGWVKTGADGRYAIYTVRPAPYPNAAIPAHIHFSVAEPGQPNEYYIDDVLFDDDPLLTSAERARQPGRGGTGILQWQHRSNLLLAERDVVLGKNIPNYR